MTTTGPATTAQINYAMSLITQLRENLTIVSDHDRRWNAERRLDISTYRSRCLALGYESMRDVPAETKKMVKETLIQEHITGTEALAEITHEQVEAMDRREVSTLIDTLKNRPW